MKHKIIQNQIIYYQDLGQKNKPIIFLLHGLGTDHTCFENQIETLKHKYRLIIPDLPGFGKSSNTNKDYNFETLISYIEEFISNFKLKKFSIIALSMGSIISYRLEKKFTKNIGKIIFISMPINIKNLPLKTKAPLVLRYLACIFLSFKIIAKKISKKTFPNHPEFQEKFFQQILKCKKNNYIKLISKLRNTNIQKTNLTNNKFHFFYGRDDFIINEKFQSKFINKK